MKRKILWAIVGTLVAVTLVDYIDAHYAAKTVKFTPQRLMLLHMAKTKSLLFTLSFLGLGHAVDRILSYR